MLFRILICALLFANSPFTFAQKNDPIRMADIEGTWFVNMSNFPMWLKGKKQNPRFKYTVLSDNKMLDEVTFEKKGKTKQIIGYDERSAEYKEGFIWQGKGLKSLITSKWKIIHYNKEYQVAVLAFEKTLFTPSGYDVISRKKKLSPKLLDIIQKLLPKIGVKEKLTEIEQH
ncbi:MAG: hypothetical protein GQ574_05190 [Crocinitomix sp.]|nr:hypothetical protein [Crocinitomix sp.]